MWTLHAPSNEVDVAAAGAASAEATAKAMLEAIKALLKRPMTRLFPFFDGKDHGRSQHSKL